MTADDDEQALNWRSWRFKREVSIGDIILALSVLLPLLWMLAKLDTRVEVVERGRAEDRAALAAKVNDERAAQAARDTAQDMALRDSVLRIEASVRDVQSFLMNNARAPAMLQAPAAPRP